MNDLLNENGTIQEYPVLTHYKLNFKSNATKLDIVNVLNGMGLVFTSEDDGADLKTQFGASARHFEKVGE
jgi:hypothetical protein